MKKYIWGINGQSGDKILYATDDNDAIQKIIAQVGSSADFWFTPVA
jgi:hypothetical protein